MRCISWVMHGFSGVVSPELYFRGWADIIYFGRLINSSWADNKAFDYLDIHSSCGPDVGFWMPSVNAQHPCQIMKKEHSNPLWHLRLLVTIQGDAVGNQGATNLKHGGQQDFNNDGSSIWCYWDAVGDIQDDDRHGEERFYDKCHALAEFRWECEGQNGERSDHHTRNYDIEEEEARDAANVDVEGDIRIRFRTAAAMGKKIVLR